MTKLFTILIFICTISCLGCSDGANREISKSEQSNHASLQDRKNEVETEEKEREKNAKSAAETAEEMWKEKEKKYEALKKEYNIFIEKYNTEVSKIATEMGEDPDEFLIKIGTFPDMLSYPEKKFVNGGRIISYNDYDKLFKIEGDFYLPWMPIPDGLTWFYNSNERKNKNINGLPRSRICGILTCHINATARRQKKLYILMNAITRILNPGKEDQIMEALGFVHGDSYGIVSSSSIEKDLNMENSYYYFHYLSNVILYKAAFYVE